MVVFNPTLQFEPIETPPLNSDREHRGLWISHPGITPPINLNSTYGVAAADYAALTHEAPRTIEHVASVNAWDGQHEASRLEVLAPAHGRAFMDAACDALGVVLIRPYVGEKEFARFWKDYEPVIGRPLAG